MSYYPQAYNKFKFEMSKNDNGFLVYDISSTNDLPNVTEGAVIGMTFGWICATILFYVLGMCVIKQCAKKYFTSSEKSSDQPRPRKPSSSSDQPVLKGTTQPRSRLDPELAGEKHKRKIYQENPTIELINITQQNADDASRKRKAYDPNTINLQLDERLDPKEN